MTGKKLFIFVLAIILVGGSAIFGAVAGGVVVYRLMSQNQPAATLPASPTAVSAVPVNSQSLTLQVNTVDVETAITKAVQNVGPTVVTVVATIPSQQTFFGPTGEETSTGSGVIISSEGYVLTNNHVVEGADKFQVIYSDGSQQDATLVGTDQYSDIAVLKVTGTIPAVATLGNSDALNPGETVIAIGSPLGDFKNTVTVGVVSATGRSIDTGQGYTIDGLIQTDAAINQGNSGGPLVNLAGEVIAINTLIIRSSGSGTVAEGLGFAIPINTARAVADQIIQNGYVSRPYLGISWQPITPRVAAIYRLPVQYGVYITDVAANSPASKAGLQVGDIITAIDTTTLDETHAYINTLFQYSAGDTVTLTANRNGKQIQVQATLGESSS
jgi:serine protease Do